MNPYDRYCMENDVNPRKGEYMDTGIVFTPNDFYERYKFALADSSHFLDFVAEKYPYCIDNYVKEYLTAYNEFLEDETRA